MPTDTTKGMIHFWDDFLGDTINLDLYVVNADTGGTAFAINTQHNGVVRGTGDGTDNDITNIMGPAQWRPDAGGPLTFEARVTLITSIADGETFIGLCNTATDVTPLLVSATDVQTQGTGVTDAAGFAYTGAGTADWKAVSVNADADGTVTRLNRGGATTPVAATWQTFKVVINVDGDADFYINGVWHYREDLAVAPTVLLALFVAQQDGGTARSTDIDYFEVWAGRR